MRSAACVLTFVSLTACALGDGVTFTARPTATRVGEQVKIAFAVSAPTDVEVAIVNAEGKVVRSLAAGVLGGPNPPPAPLKPGLAQELVWDGKGDWGLPVGGGPFTVRVRAEAAAGRRAAAGTPNAALRASHAEIPLAYPVAAKASFKHIYVADSANRRVVRVDPTWQAEATCEVK